MPTGLVSAKPVDEVRPTEQYRPLAIASEADAARSKLQKWIRRGEEIESTFVAMPGPEDVERKSSEWHKTQLRLADYLTKTERSAITLWNAGVIRELQAIGGGALGLYSANEELSYALFSALADNRTFLRERLDEVRQILARVERPSGQQVAAARRIRTELVDAQRKAKTYVDALEKLPPNFGLHYEKGFRFDTQAWEEHSVALAGRTDIYPTLESTYQELGRANDVIGWRATGAKGLYGVNRQEDNLPGVLSAATAGIEALDTFLAEAKA